jgi:hypothetical protein
MKNLIIIALVLATVGWAGNKYVLQKDSEPERICKEFLTAIVRYDLTESNLALADGEAPKQLARKLGVVLIEDWLSGTHHVSYSVDSKQKREDGKRMTLVISQSARVDPAGIHSGLGTMMLKANYTATMINTANGWKVSSFKWNDITVGKDGKIELREDGKIQSIYGPSWTTL